MTGILSVQQEYRVYGVTQDQIDRYANSLEQHIRYVREACTRIGGVTFDQMVSHDRSKWTVEEFPFYARKFHGGWMTGEEKERIDRDFARAWLHHLHHNPHHWQHWIFPDGFKPRVIEMPANYQKYWATCEDEDGAA